MKTRAEIQTSGAGLMRAAGLLLMAALLPLLSARPALADRVHLKGGGVIQADEVWESPEGVWYKRGGVEEFVSRSRVERVERTARAGSPSKPEELNAKASPAPVTQAVWIHLKGGARMQVEEAAESAEGVWYRRGNLSALIAKERVERVERAGSEVVGGASSPSGRGVYQWTTGKAALDGLIRESAARHGLDPYLVFCVMEQESHFNPRAVSPAGARGLMQLMPGTARRLGVRKIDDPAQNIDAGARYLKELGGLFGARLDLVLAGYNAGEGAVLKYGRRVPPYTETRNYVRRISGRYGAGPTALAAKQ